MRNIHIRQNRKLVLKVCGLPCRGAVEGGIQLNNGGAYHKLGSRQLGDAGRVIKDRGRIVGLTNKRRPLSRCGGAIFIKREATGQSVFTQAHESGEHEASEPLQFPHFCPPLYGRFTYLPISDTYS